MRIWSLAAAMMAVLMHLPLEAVARDQCSGDVNAEDQVFLGEMSCSGGTKTPPEPATQNDPGVSQFDDYMCHSALPSCAGITCAFPDPCSRPKAYLELWGHTTNGQVWISIRKECVDPTKIGDAPAITPALVQHELERVGLPALTVHTNPAGKTLVNLATVFYTDPTTVTKTLTLLGQSVLVEATPARYTWHFGDARTSSTDSPGAPYPAFDLTHRYAQARVTVHPRVDTTYTARFRVNGGAWQDVDGTVTMAGPATDLRVAEATPVLSGNR
jgi:hypothetical protein